MAALDQLLPCTDIQGPCLDFDFPGLRIGIGEYREGPTGTTVFHFPNKAIAAVDVRGGMPGTYNVDALRLGYDFPFLDAITISGGSWYGLQAASGVAAALKEDGLKSGDWRNLANVAGAIVYDFGDRRLTEVSPDAALGAAALRAARPGRFPLGAQGAGRMVMQGGYYGLSLHSGQGAAFRQIGETRIAAFAVANPLGLLVDRAGRIVAGTEAMPGVTTIHDLLRRLPLERDEDGAARRGQISQTASGAGPANSANTTISVVVINQVMPFHALQRLAYQVHGSMGRAIQPFATAADGDVLFAASTNAVTNPSLHPMDVATIASEVMWDALLSATAPRPYRPVGSTIRPVTGFRARFGFAAGVEIAINVDGTMATVEIVGTRSVYGIAQGTRIAATLSPDGSFQIARPDAAPLPGAFIGSAARVDQLLLNTGPWEQIGRRIDIA